MNRDGAMKAVIELVEKLLSLQLSLNYEHPREAFSKLMTNRVAAGYVFGFHDSCFQILGLVDLPLNFHPAAIRASANVTPFGAVSVPA